MTSLLTPHADKHTEFYFDQVLECHDNMFTKHFIFGHPAWFKIRTTPSNGVNLWHSFRIDKKVVDEEVEGDTKRVA